MFVEASKLMTIDRYAKCYNLYVIGPSALNAKYYCALSLWFSSLLLTISSVVFKEIQFVIAVLILTIN